MVSFVNVTSLLMLLLSCGTFVKGDCQHLIEDEVFGTNLCYEVNPDRKLVYDISFECRLHGGTAINTTNTALLSYIVTASGASETSFWMDQHALSLDFVPTCRYYDNVTDLIVETQSISCYYDTRRTICAYVEDGYVPFPPGTEHCPYGFVEKVHYNLCFAAILIRSISSSFESYCNDYGVSSIPIVYDANETHHIDLLKDAVDAVGYHDLMYTIKKENDLCHVFHRDREDITQEPCSDLENRVLCQHNMTDNGPCPDGAVFGDYPPGYCYFVTDERSKNDIYMACPSGSSVVTTSDLSRLHWIAESVNLEGSSFFIAPLFVVTSLYNDTSQEITYDTSTYQLLHRFICIRNAEAVAIASSENQTSEWSSTSSIRTIIFNQESSSESPTTTKTGFSSSYTSTPQLQSESEGTLRNIYSSRTYMTTPTTSRYDYQTSTDQQNSQEIDYSILTEESTPQMSTDSNVGSTQARSTVSSNGHSSTPNPQSSSVVLSTGSHSSPDSQNISEQLTTSFNQLTSDLQFTQSNYSGHVDFQSNLMTTENTSTGYNLTGSNAINELSTEACNGRCELSLEKRLANATLDDVSSIVENEDLNSEDILRIQEWFEDNAYIREDEGNYLSYTTTYLKTFNDLLISTKEDTFDLANPAVFAEACSEVLEDFATKWSFNSTLEISFSNIETDIVRESADAFQGFTSDFNVPQNTEQLDSHIFIQNDWVEDYNTTDNSTIDIIVTLVQASMYDDLGNDETNDIVSSFVSVIVFVDSDPVSLPVTIGFDLDEEKLGVLGGDDQVILEPLCVFWDDALGNDPVGFWNTFGCEVVFKNRTYVVCSCNHTTNFAILMQTTEVEISQKDEAALSLLSLIGLAISTAALLVTIIVLSCLPSLKSDRVFIHKHLVVALIIAQTLFISTVGAIHQELICKFVAIFLHYFYLAVFMWMLIEGVHLYLEIVQVFSRFDGKNKIVYYIMTGWGLPLIVVVVSVAIRWRNYGVGNGCWLSIEDGLIWAFLGPVAFVIVINCIILLMVIRVVFRASSARGADDGEYKHLVAALKGALFLLPLLGLTWAVGFMSVNEGTLVFQYLFVILNSLQGLFIFLFYCAMNKEVRTALSRRFSQVALESGGSKSLSLRAVAKLKTSGKSISPVLRFTDSSGSSELQFKSSSVHSEDDGKRESISASGISVHQKEPDSQHTQTRNEESKSPFSPDYD